MANGSQTIFRVSGVMVAVLLALGGKWAVDATKLPTLPSSRLPTSEELDSLRGYVAKPSAPIAVARAVIPAAGGAGLNPFAKVTLLEAPKYLSEQALGSAAPRVTRPQWLVTTIMITDTRRVAVVNGTLVSAGSALSGGARIVSIEADHVVLTDASGNRRTVPVQNSGEQE